jgi:hypothetical protein
MKLFVPIPKSAPVVIAGLQLWVCKASSRDGERTITRVPWQGRARE